MSFTREEGVGFMQRKLGMAFLFSYTSQKRQIRMLWGAQREAVFEKPGSVLENTNKKVGVSNSQVVPEEQRDSGGWFRIFLWGWFIVFLLYLGVAAYLLGADNISSLSFAPFKSASETRPLSSGGTEWENSLGMKFVRIGDTLFSLQPASLRNVRSLSKHAPLAIDWKEPNYISPHEPVTGITWNDAVSFCKWLTHKERKEGLLSNTQFYRLPRTSEWSHVEAVVADPPYFSNLSSTFPKIGKMWEWCMDPCPINFNAHLVRGDADPQNKSLRFGQEAVGLDSNGRGFRCVLVDPVSL